MIISTKTGSTVETTVWISVHASDMTCWISGMLAVMRSVTCWMIGQTVVVMASATWPNASMIVPITGTRPDTIEAMTGAIAATSPPMASEKLFTTITAAAKSP